MTGRVLRHVVVVGGAGELGRAIVSSLLDGESILAVADIDCDTVRDELAQRSPASFCRTVDVRDRESVRELFVQAERRFGKLDVLINASGVPGRGLIDEVDENLWDQVVAVNLSGVYWSCRFALPLLRKGSSAMIINIASVAGLREQPGSAIYSATKGGVVMLTRTIAADLAREGIRAFAVCPPPLSTRLVLRAFEERVDPAAARAEYEQSLISGRLGEVGEVAALVQRIVDGDSGPFSVEPSVV